MIADLLRGWRRMLAGDDAGEGGAVPAEAPPQDMFEGRIWYKDEGAPAEAIEQLQAIAPFALPESYLSLLRYSNGGEGPLPVDPFTFTLDSIEEVVSSRLDDPSLQEWYPDFFFIAGTGGCDRIAFDMRGGEQPYPLVSIDMCGGGIEYAVAIAPSFDALLELIGLEDEEFRQRRS